MGRSTDSWDLVHQNWDVLRRDPELLLFPLLSVVTVAAFLLATLAIGVGLLLLTFAFAQAGSLAGAVAFLLLALLTIPLVVLVVLFGLVFFDAALAAAIHERLAGGDPTVPSGLRRAWQRRGKLLRWSVVLTAYGLGLRGVWRVRTVLTVLARVPHADAFTVGTLGVTWELESYFVVPILLEEDRSVHESVHRSEALAKARWGGRLAAGPTMGRAMFQVLAAILFGTGLAATVAFFLGPFGILVAIALLAAALAGTLLAVVWFGMLSEVYRVALYRYASTGQAPPEYDVEYLKRAFRPLRAPS